MTQPLVEFKKVCVCVRVLAEQASRERDKVKADLDHADQRNLQLVSEVDDRHASMENLNQSRIRSDSHVHVYTCIKQPQCSQIGTDWRVTLASPHVVNLWVALLRPALVLGNIMSYQHGVIGVSAEITQ